MHVWSSASYSGRDDSDFVSIQLLAVDGDVRYHDICFRLIFFTSYYDDVELNVKSQLRKRGELLHLLYHIRIDFISGHFQQICLNFLSPLETFSVRSFDKFIRDIWLLDISYFLLQSGQKVQEIYGRKRDEKSIKVHICDILNNYNLLCTDFIII